MFLKLAFVETAVFVANGFDAAANRLVLLGAAAAAVTYLTIKVLTAIRLGIQILRRLHASADTFQQLPEWARRVDDRFDQHEKAVDERFSGLEAEVGIVQHQVAVVSNGQEAIIRELDIEDQVRKVPPRRGPGTDAPSPA